MKTTTAFSMIFLASVSFFIGCGGSDDYEGNAASTSPTSDTTAEASPTATQTLPGTFDKDAIEFEIPPVRPGLLTPEMSSTPANTVREFLAALQGGKRELAEALLTDTARIETARHNLPIKAPGRPSAVFEVGETEMISEENDGNMNGAYVDSTWSDTYDDGTTEMHDIVWILRNEKNGWRVAGMATQVFEDMDLLILNFEDPEDMERRFKWVEEEERRRMQAAASQQDDLQATRPQDPGTPTQQQ